MHCLENIPRHLVCAGQFLEITMSNCIISSYSRNADGTATVTLTFSLFNGPVSVRQ